MKHKILAQFTGIFTFLILSICNVHAQFSVKGTLVDSLTHESEPYATIRITLDKSPEKPVRMNVTDAKGKFQEKLPQTGNYTLQITSVGKRTVVRRFSITNNQRMADLGTLYTCDDAQMLKGVEVVAQKPLVKAEIDKISYSIEDDPDSKTNTTLEMLRKVPLVTVDGEDNIQVNGSSNFKVHVNADTFRSWSENSYPSRRYGISISWRFGELKTQVKKTQRSITNDDVKAGGDNKSGGSMQ
ncbi:carboxypeptidase regulatory-like domain-containing protein [Phocaeicola plebeius]|uniref:carboxypeptidase regulatory-like domain-containing protein n=1 Tax=Phocaeicola plebeius TaxID=310297 RepID=UPI003977E534